MFGLAICVPTYHSDNAEIVKNVLDRSIGYLQESNIDIYYYYSSEKKHIEELVIGMNKAIL